MFDGMVNLLSSGFRGRTRGCWRNALKRLSEHLTRPGLPKYGYLLECKGTPVGLSLLIFLSLLVRFLRTKIVGAITPGSHPPEFAVALD